MGARARHLSPSSPTRPARFIRRSLTRRAWVELRGFERVRYKLCSPTAPIGCAGRRQVSFPELIVADLPAHLDISTRPSENGLVFTSPGEVCDLLCVQRSIGIGAM